MKNEKIGIIGSGLIGRAWSMLFASVGYQVMLYDILPEQIQTALEEIEKEVNLLESRGILRGTLNAKEQLACISSTTNLTTLCMDTAYIQECVPERLDIKKSLYNELDCLIKSDTILASSTSTFIPKLFSENMQNRTNVIVAHPLNPPYYIPLVEIVPSQWTNKMFVQRTFDLMVEIGQKPVTLKREVEGFATNRLQYALLNEVWRLIADDIITVEDIDSVMTNGLGLRYAFLGPLETAHLNANGVADYFERFGSEIFAVSQTYGPTPKMRAGPVLDNIALQCEQMTPKQALNSRRSQRDEFLSAVTSLKEQLKKSR